MKLLQRYPIWIVWVAIFIAITLFSYFTYWTGDDIYYQYNFRNFEQDDYIDSYGEVIESLNAHFFSRNGRYVAHFFVQCFEALWGRLAFSIVNGLFYVLFLYFMCKLAKIAMKNTSLALLATLVALIALQTKMMPSCQIGYIWSFAAIMVFVYIFLNIKKIVLGGG